MSWDWTGMTDLTQRAWRVIFMHCIRSHRRFQRVGLLWGSSLIVRGDLKTDAWAIWFEELGHVLLTSLKPDANRMGHGFAVGTLGGDGWSIALKSQQFDVSGLIAALLDLNSATWSSVAQASCLVVGYARGLILMTEIISTFYRDVLLGASRVIGHF